MPHSYHQTLPFPHNISVLFPGYDNENGTEAIKSRLA